jgi:antitoxin CcdA
MAKSRKRPTNVSVDAALLAKARALNVNLSQALEEKLAELVTAAERLRWRAESRAAIDAYNARVEKGALLSDDERQF